MHRLAVVAQRLLCKPLRVAALLGAFGPGITVGMQRHTLDTKPPATLLELSRTVATPDGLQVGKQRAGVWQTAKNRLDLFAKVDHRETAGLLACVGDGSVAPINILRFQVGDVSLRAAEMPAQLVKAPPLRILFALQDELMLLDGDRSFGLKTNFWPEALGNDRPGQPIHREAEVVQLA